jgi:hypothetical protein
MKAKAKSQKSGLRNRSERLATAATASPAAPTERKDTRLPIDFNQRRRYRTLPTEGLLHLLGTKLPEVYGLAEVVGRWVWVQFREVPAAELRRQLAQFGFHWNNTRQAWQHPCGLWRDAASYDPRRRYGSYFPADVKPA